MLTSKNEKVKKLEPVVNELYTDESDFPSKVTTFRWVWAIPKVHIEHSQKVSDKTGKWLVFSSVKDLDNTWQKIKEATQHGILGTWAKSATAQLSPDAFSENEKVICIYTYNKLDTNDVWRVEKALRTIGVLQTLYYKADSESENGQYKNRGSKNISMLMSPAVKRYDRTDIRCLYNVSDSKRNILNEMGINDLNDLLSFDTTDNRKIFDVPLHYIEQLKLSALSHVEQRIFQLNPFQFPTTDILHFDIETELFKPHATTRVWSIAVHHKKKVKHFYAETLKKEKNILEDFLKYLKTFSGIPIYSYSSFDVSVLKCALKRHNLDVDFFLNCNHFDLCKIIKQNYVLPIKGYGLKEVGSYFGYKFKSMYGNGLAMAMTYMRCEYSGTKMSLREESEVLAYIMDDVKVMDFIIKQFQKRKDIKNLFELNGIDIKQLQEKESLKQRSQNKTIFAISSNLEELQDKRIPQRNNNLSSLKNAVVTTGNYLISGTTAILKGIIEDCDILPLIDYGHCWSVTTSKPNIRNNVIYTNTISKGEFDTNLPLIPNTTYYFRAFAKNGSDISYGTIETITL